jgi:hypothetical protein
MTNNPLAKFFRQPAIYIRLPSNGSTWAPGSIVMPENLELPVLPMTAIDEITYRTPDALYNGEAVTSVIQSCLPNIKDAWACPSSDLDVLLVAIRIATYGHTIDIESACPACTEEHEFGLDLRTVIDNLKGAIFSKPMKYGDLEFYFKPLNYREMTDNSLLQFEQQKTLQQLNESDADEKLKMTKINQMMRTLILVNIHALSQSILEIRTQTAIVSDTAQIEEFLNNCDRTIFNTVRDYVINLREESELKPLEITCPSCQHHYQQPFTLDMANFFVAAS